MGGVLELANHRVNLVVFVLRKTISSGGNMCEHE